MEKKQVQTHKLNSLFWLWQQDKSHDPQEFQYLTEFQYCRIAALEKAFGKYQGSKQEEKFRFLHYGQHCVYDFLRMVVIEGGEHNDEERSIIRGKTAQIQRYNCFRNLKDLYVQVYKIDEAHKFKSIGDIWFAKSKKMPTFRELVQSCSDNSSWLVKDKLKIEHYKQYWKYIMKASGIENYDEEIKIEDIQNPDSLICQVLVFIASTDDFILVLFQSLPVGSLNKDLTFNKKKLKKLKFKIKNIETDIQNYHSKGPYFYLLENGIFEAQIKKKKQLVAPFSLYYYTKEIKFFTHQSDCVCCAVKSHPIIQFESTMLFCRNDSFDFLEDVECRFCYKCECKNKLKIIQINIDNIQNFKHFVIDSQKYSMFHDDDRVIVSNQNKFILMNEESKENEQGNGHHLRLTLNFVDDLL